MVSYSHERADPRHVLLAIEVSHESSSYDTGDKAALYAAHGVQEYRAIHAPTRKARVHRRPSAQGWAEVREVGEALAPLCAPEAALKLEP